MKKAKFVGTIFGIVLFIALIAGFTYAWLSWRSNNIEMRGTTGCFNIDYGVSQQIGSDSVKESLEMTSIYTEGLSAKVSLALKSTCSNVLGTATLYLNTSSASSNILNGALKYTVLNGDTVIGTGVINTSDRITLINDIDISSTTPTTYTVYVWLDGSVADNSYANVSYTGYISAEAVSK